MSTKIENVEGTVEEPKVEEPRKIILGKRVIRQFAVKSGVQTGVADRCSRSYPFPP